VVVGLLQTTQLPHPEVRALQARVSQVATDNQTRFQKVLAAAVVVVVQ
jgi:hypothetical protein